ncbi:YkgJ family cysteine cluster protein [Amphritea balenae]|uniref:YkgJ family cysteine cluster protein n=1 Tax=Amphritea balenae TaxID=452629 RepID=A0A3P1SUX5_9GAMM|nr:YkgJ family cysteine cluster protein [Amphritea balenae]RRD01017.1 YkgJ family cysteine cluster protein [Amphritea balenae]GGK60677.1 zinc/iron-chelating domain-containing protein [Amphritea balenae]
MKCRSGCAACCIAPHISTPIPNMPAGKPAGVPCSNLDAQLNCKIWNDPAYPALCQAFIADQEHCGNNRVQALHILNLLEAETAPDV